jgi:Post-segregation antitoxin CcdA
MNTPTVRVNLTFPTDVVDYLKRNTENISKYVSEAVRERIAREKRKKALDELLTAKPVLPDVKDGTTFTRALRSADRKRDERLGIV